MRRNQAPIREIAPDPKYNSAQLSKFINRIMYDGKKSTAQAVVYGSLDIIAERTGKPAIEVFEHAIQNASPVVEVKPRRVGGATYQVPMEVSKKRQQALAIRWLINAATGRKGKPMHERLAEELSDAYKREGAAVKKREETHRMADANKAFAHFAW